MVNTSWKKRAGEMAVHVAVIEHGLAGTGCLERTCTMDWRSEDADGK